MPYFKFIAERVIEADSEDDALDTFQSNSFDFASEAEVYECDELGNIKQ